MIANKFLRWILPVGRMVSLLALATALIGSRAEAASVAFTETPLGGGLFEVDFLVAGMQFQANEELAVEFSGNLYSLLQNQTAGPGFDLLLFQPNQPAGAPGVYSALAMHALTASGVFSVQARVIGGGVPAPQHFALNLYDANGNFVQVLDSGVTASAVPEPGSLPVNLVLMLIAGIVSAARRRT